MQTLQIYRRVEKIPSDVQIKRMTREIETVKKSFPAHLPPIKRESVNEPVEEIEVKSIEWQNTLTDIDKILSHWIKDYREMIDVICEYDRIMPKDEHDLQESDEKAQENVDKIKKVIEIKEEIVGKFKDICIRYEDDDIRSRRRIRQLESQLIGTQAKVENLDYQLERCRNGKKCSLSEY